MVKFVCVLNKDKLINIFFTNFFFFSFFKLFLYNLMWFHKIYKINIYTVRKFTYTGKIFRLKFLKKKIKFFFNRRHRNFLYFRKNIFIKKLGKKLFRLIFIFKKDFFYFKGAYKMIRKLNIFTWRGITFSHTFLNKKQGKISSYKRGISY